MCLNPTCLPITTGNYCSTLAEPSFEYLRLLKLQRRSWWQLCITAFSENLGSRDGRNVRLPVDSSWDTQGGQDSEAPKVMVAGPHSKPLGSRMSGLRGPHAESEGRNHKWRPLGCPKVSVHSTFSLPSWKDSELCIYIFPSNTSKGSK